MLNTTVNADCGDIIQGSEGGSKARAQANGLELRGLVGCIDNYFLWMLEAGFEVRPLSK